LRQRVLAYVTRERGGRKELLVFDHADEPEAGTQIPAGRVDPGETLEQCLHRELYEEAGIEHARIVRELEVAGEWVERSRYENHAYEVALEEDAAERWDHVVLGDGDDAGLVFRYRWEPVRPDLRLFNRPDHALAQLA
jgi:8-oxo-dGTP pyrophosphatase MutT (NUDIX family)